MPPFFGSIHLDGVFGFSAEKIRMKVHRRTDFFGHECLVLGVGGSAEIRMMFGFVNPYEIFDHPSARFFPYGAATLLIFQVTSSSK